jgi:hypothetical protein
MNYFNLLLQRHVNRMKIYFFTVGVCKIMLISLSYS